MNLDVDLLLDELADRVAARLRLHVESAPAAQSWRLLDVDEVAERLGRSTRWVRERAKRGDLPFVKLDGGAFAFEESDLRAFARARRVSLDDAEVSAAECRQGRNPVSRNGSSAAHQVDNRRVRS